MAFTNLLTDELIIPSDATLGAGSGAIYIGGPNLPAELVAFGATAGIVVYSSGTEALTWKYSFIVDAPSQGWCQGQVDVNGNLFVVQRMVAAGGGPLFEPGLTLSASAITMNVDSPVAIYRFKGNGFLVNSVILNDVNGARPYIGIVNSTYIDKWNQITDVQVVGAATVTTIVEWKQTIDYMVELRFKITTAGATIPPGTTWNVPVAGLPTPNNVGDDLLGYVVEGVMRSNDFPATGFAYLSPFFVNTVAGNAIVQPFYAGPSAGPNLSTATGHAVYAATKP